MRQPLAIGHTYYSPSLGRVLGAAPTELARCLHDAWVHHADSVEPEHTDGASAWLDLGGHPHLAIVVGRHVTFPSDPAALDAIARALAHAPREGDLDATREVLSRRDAA
jgi:hypothetical protein